MALRLALEPALEGSTQHGLAKLTLCTRHTHCSTGQRSCATVAGARPDGASFLVLLPCVPSSPPGSPSGSPPPAAEETGHLHTAPEEEDLDAEVKLEPPETEEHLVTPMPNKKLSESTAGAEISINMRNLTKRLICLEKQAFLGKKWSSENRKAHFEVEFPPHNPTFPLNGWHYRITLVLSFPMALAI